MGRTSNQTCFNVISGAADEGASKVERKPDPVDIAVGARIRLHRMARGMSQDKLAKALGISFQQVQKYERGANRIGASRLRRIAEALNVPIHHLFDTHLGQTAADGTSANSEEHELLDFILTAEGKALNRAFGRIESPAVRQKLVALVVAFARQPEDNPQK